MTSPPEKRLGLIGGVGPESTIEYYRLLIAGYREKAGGTYPPIIINSVDLKRLLDWMAVNNLDSVTEYLLQEIEKLRQAGATFQQLGFRRVALFGTRYTMQARFYPKVFEAAGVSLFVPGPSEQNYIHDKYLGELLKDIFLPMTRSRLLAIAEAMKQRHAIQALILGGTELPLLLRDEAHNGIQLLDTTRIHVDRLLAELFN